MQQRVETRKREREREHVGELREHVVKGLCFLLDLRLFFVVSCLRGWLIWLADWLISPFQLCVLLHPMSSTFVAGLEDDAPLGGATRDVVIGGDRSFTPGRSRSNNHSQPVSAAFV